MTSLAVRKFTRHDAAAIRRAVRAYMGQPVIVETGTRHDPAGMLTADSTRWDDDTDLQDMCDLNEVREQLTPGFTLDLYIFDRLGEAGDGLLQNLDARWDGTMWTVVDPFSPTYTRSSTPTR